MIVYEKCIIPPEPHFYIAKVGYAGVYLFFLNFAAKHILWVLVRTASMIKSKKKTKKKQTNKQTNKKT